MSSSRLWIQTCVLLLTCFGFTSPSFARSSFDGEALFCCPELGAGGYRSRPEQAERRSYGAQVMERIPATSRRLP